VALAACPPVPGARRASMYSSGKSEEEEEVEEKEKEEEEEM
jgi:hypothetical protein